MRFQQLITLISLSVICAEAQSLPSVLGNSYLNGKYYFRHLQLTTDTSGNITDCRGALGAITFDGAGHYSLAGQQTVGTSAATSLTGSGTYSVSAGGLMTIGNPQRNTLTINARVGPEAIVGSTSESGDNTFDLFVAIPAPTTTMSISFTGPYSASVLEFPGATGASARSSFFTLLPSNSGVFTTFNVTGHARNVNQGAISNGTISSATYALTGDGSGTAFFGEVNPLLSGSKNVYLSQSGNVMIGGSITPGSQDILVAVKSFTGTASLNNLTGLFFTGGLRFDTVSPSTAGYAGSMNAAPSLQKVISSQREHQIGIAPGFDFTGVNALSLNSDGTYTVQFNLLGLGAAGNSFVDTSLSQFDPGGYAIDFGVRAPALAGTGVYINPQGVLNGGSFAPIGPAISPGEFLTIFGSGLAAKQVVATPPYPLSLGGVSVTVNGAPAPIYLVSPTQLNILIPYGVTGSTATIVVTNGTASNSVVLPVGKTSPGIFSLDSTGTGAGAILHADFSVVNAAKPAARGETVLIYLTGLGAVTPAVPDGVASGSNPVSNANNPVAVLINGQAATVLFAGLAPGLPGLYQINATIPKNLIGSGAAALAVQTVDAFHDMVDIPIQQ